MRSCTVQVIGNRGEDGLIGSSLPATLMENHGEKKESKKGQQKRGQDTARLRDTDSHFQHHWLRSCVFQKSLLAASFAIYLWVFVTANPLTLTLTLHNYTLRCKVSIHLNSLRDHSHRDQYCSWEASAYPQQSLDGRHPMTAGYQSLDGRHGTPRMRSQFAKGQHKHTKQITMQ